MGVPEPEQRFPECCAFAIGALSPRDARVTTPILHPTPGLCLAHSPHVCPERRRHELLRPLCVIALLKHDRDAHVVARLPQRVEQLRDLGRLGARAAAFPERVRAREDERAARLRGLASRYERPDEPGEL